MLEKEISRGESDIDQSFLQPNLHNAGLKKTTRNPTIVNHIYGISGVAGGGFVRGKNLEPWLWKRVYVNDIVCSLAFSKQARERERADER